VAIGESPTSGDYLAASRAFAPALAARAAEIERRRELPEAIRDGLIERGFYRLLLPRSLGGAELLPADFVPVIEEIAKADASTAWCLNQTAGCSMIAAYLEPEAAREIFGGPRGILAWGPGPGTARVVAGGYRVTASFSFASGSHEASWLGAHLPVVGADGTACRAPDGSPIVRTLLFPKAAAQMSDIWHVIGLKGTGSDRCAVLRRPPGGGAARERAPLPLQQPAALQRRLCRGGDGHRPQHARRLRRAGAPQDPARRHAHAADNNVIQSQVAQAEAKLAAARAYLLGALDATTAALARQRRLTLDQRMTIRLAATFAIHQARDAVDSAYHAAGATAIFAENPFERRFRDIHTVSQQLQGRQEHYETVGQYLLGLEPDSLMWL
jgi:alkylation response protein AidB-like acyl-CoA dehydrogenase